MTGAGTLTIANVIEHVAYEAGKSPAEVLTSRRAYDVWLRRLSVWLARHVARLTRGEINEGLGRTFDAAGQDIQYARRLHESDAEFRRFAAVITSALVVL